MNEQSIIRLDEDYVFFQDGQYICVYRKSTKLVMLKLKTGNDTYNEAIRDELQRPHKVRWLAKQPYWKWLSIVLLKHPEFFREISEMEAKRCAEESDYYSVVNRTHFAENYQIDASLRNIRVFLWGATPLNKLLYENLKDTVTELYIIRNEEDMVDENSFLGGTGELKLENSIPEGYMLSAEEMEQWQTTKDDLFLIDVTGLKTDKLIELNDYAVSKEAAALFYGNTREKAVIGPLVIGGESACLRCMQAQDILTEFYPGENGFLDRAVWHLFAYFIIRILYYIKGRNLYYLLSDAQIPINKVMTVSRDDMTAKMKYLHRDVNCPCCK